MDKARQLLALVAAFGLGFGLGGEGRSLGMSIAQLGIDQAHVSAPGVAEHGPIWTAGSAGKGWSDLFM